MNSLPEVDARHFLDALEKAEKSRQQARSYFSGSRKYQHICVDSSGNIVATEKTTAYLLYKPLLSIKSLFQTRIDKNIRKLSFEEMTELTRQFLAKNLTSDQIDKNELAEKFKGLISRYDAKKVNWVAQLIFPKWQKERDDLVKKANEVVLSYSPSKEQSKMDCDNHQLKKTPPSSPTSVTDFLIKEKETSTYQSEAKEPRSPSPPSASKKAYNTFSLDDPVIKKHYEQAQFQGENKPRLKHDPASKSEKHPKESDEDPRIIELELGLDKMENDLAAILSPSKEQYTPERLSSEEKHPFIPPSYEEWEKKMSQLTGHLDDIPEEDEKEEPVISTGTNLDKEVSKLDADLKDIIEELEDMIHQSRPKTN